MPENALLSLLMIRAALPIIFAALAWTAFAMEEPCRNVQMDLAFTACWREEFKKSEAEFARRLRVLAECHHKDEPNLHRLMKKAQQAWLVWREAACRVDTYESIGGSGFSVYWDRCRIKMNQARATELQDMIK
ncbi:MAG: lysozyme inhibitor LprI family protein [Tardiphaga sp.]